VPAFPGIPGFIAFAGVKFGGYCLAGLALRKLRPTVTASAVRIAAARTGLGILIGLPLTFGLTLAIAKLFPETNDNFTISAVYALVFALRTLIWALVIYHFVDELDFQESKLWGLSAIGAVWSCLLDLPGLGLAIISPGQIPIC